MKSRFSVVFAFLLLCTIAGAADKTAAPKPVIEKGMEDTAIRQALGLPDKVEDLKSTGVKAETWIYRRKVNEGTYQTASGQTTIPAMVAGGPTGMTMGQAIVPDYRLKFVKVYQVTALLMVDGKLERGRQWTEREESFAN